MPKVSIPYSSGNKKIVWKWDSEIHIDDNDKLTEPFWRWRLAGKNNKEPVRCPVGWKRLKNCCYSLEKDEEPLETNPKLNYIESRKKIYLPIYIEAVVKESKFLELRDRLFKGENLLIVEVDGPHQESMGYYQELYGIPDNFIEKDSVEATLDNLKLLLNDGKHPFGHGYCLAWALQDFSL